MNDNIIKVEKILESLKGKKNRFYFFVPSMETPNSSINQIYWNANVLVEMGYNVTILTESDEYKKPFYVDSKLTNIKHQKVSEKISISPEDFIIIPEIFTNIMEQLKNFACEKIVLLQSLDYSLHALTPGVQWSDFGITKVITVSDELKKMVHEYFGNYYDVHRYRIGIPDSFKHNGELKKPILSFISRNGNDITDIIKLFYLKYPQFRFLTFQELNGFDKETYTRKLKESFACLWVDNISSFGTVPLECMKANTLPIGLIPRISHEYVKDYTGAWVFDLFKLPDMIASVLSTYLQDEINSKFTKTMDSVSEQYNDENSKNDLIEIYNNLIEKRIEFFTKN